MFRRLSDVRSFPLSSGDQEMPSREVLELHATIDEAFGDASVLASTSDLFVWPRLETRDPHGIVAGVFSEDKPESTPVLEAKAYIHLIAHAIPQRPVFLLGHVGVGKSTLVRHTFHEISNDNVLPIFVDFKRVRSEAKTISDFVVSEIDRTLTQHVHSDTDPDFCARVHAFLLPAREQLFDNLARFDVHAAGLARAHSLLRMQDNAGTWNQARIRYLQEHKAMQVYLVFDNVDHHIDRRFIDQTITEAMMQAAQNDCRLVMTLRQGNYGLAYERGAFAAETFTVILVAGPNRRDLVGRRVDRILRHYDSLAKRPVLQLGDRRVSVDILVTTFREHLRSLLSEPVLEMLGGFSGENLRRFLMCIRHLFNVSKLSQREELTRGVLTRYEVLERLLRPNGRAYVSPEMDAQAVATNLFDNGVPSEGGNTLLRLRALQAIAYYGTRAWVGDLSKDLGAFGTSPERTDQVLRFLSEQGLTSPGDHSEIVSSLDEVHPCYQLTSIGSFYLDKLIYEFRYALAVAEDSFFPEDVYRRMYPVHPERVDQRDMQLTVFVEYIQLLEDAEDRIQAVASVRLKCPRIAKSLELSYFDGLAKLRSAVKLK